MRPTSDCCPPSAPWPSLRPSPPTSTGRPCRLDLNNQRYATPSQINHRQRGQTRPGVGLPGGVRPPSGTPIMMDRTVYLSLPFNGVVALDAVTGKPNCGATSTRAKDYPCAAARTARAWR